MVTLYTVCINTKIDSEKQAAIKWNIMVLGSDMCLHLHCKRCDNLQQ
jgi:hypothetical protein